MASPQLKNGYTRIANEILEHIIQLPLNGTQLRIVIAVWRYTYGFSRKKHALSVNFIIEALGLNKSQYKQITRELKALIQQGVLTEVARPDKNKTRVIAFNKNHNLWPKKTTGLIRPEDELDQTLWSKKTREPLDLLDHQERKNKKTIKETISGKPPKRNKPDPGVKEFIDYYSQSFERKFGNKPLIAGAKDGGIVKELLKHLELEKLKALLDDYLELDDQFLADHGYSLALFRTRINGLQIGPNKRRRGETPRPKSLEDKLQILEAFDDDGN